MAVKGTAGERKSAILLKKYGLNRDDKTTALSIWKKMRVNKANSFRLLKSARKYDRAKGNMPSKEFIDIVKEPIYFWEIA